MNKLTTIIPVYNPDFHRKRNLEFLYNRLCDVETDIVIGVQSKFIDKYYDRFNNAKIIKVEKDGSFNKCLIFNFCMNLVNTDFLMLLDSDIYLNFKFLIENLSENEDVIKPFNECIYLNEEMTQQFISTKHVDVSDECKRISALGGGATVIKTDLIKKHNIQFDENYSGWGYEDFDFGDLLRSKDIKIKTLKQPAAHLYHEPSATNYKNITHYNNKPKPKSNIVHVFNCCSENCNHLNSYEIHRNSKVLLMNCCEMDYLNNDNFRFSFVEKETDGFCLNSVIDCAIHFLDPQGWVLYTSFQYFNKNIYNDLFESKNDYLVFFRNGKKVAFAIRKRKWQQQKIEKIYTNNERHIEIIHELFSK